MYFHFPSKVLRLYQKSYENVPNIVFRLYVSIKVVVEKYTLKKCWSLPLVLYKPQL